VISKLDVEALNYEDVVLVPQWSAINSRDDVELFHYYEKNVFIPIFSAPMKGISEPELIVAISKKGGVGILHRFFDSQETRYAAVDNISEEVNYFGVAIGVKNLDEELKFFDYAYDRGCRFICLDSASGYLQKTIEAVRTIAKHRKFNGMDFQIIAGNVVDDLGCFYLADAGTDFIRCGIGSGTLCTTTKKISIGSPTLTTAIQCSKIKDRFPNIRLIADGGISNSGQALKAFAFGMNAVMVGSLFGHSVEANNNGKIMGMSSFSHQDKMGKTRKSNEGIEINIPEDEIKPFNEIWEEFTYGLKSGLSYLGCSNLQNLHNVDIEYIKVK